MICEGIYYSDLDKKKVNRREPTSTVSKYSLLFMGILMFMFTTQMSSMAFSENNKLDLIQLAVHGNCRRWQ